MELNINQLVRSAVVLVIGLPVSLAILAQAPEKTETTELEALKTELGLPCLKFAMTNSGSKGEREAKDAIDEIVGNEVNYREACKWVLG